jgi:hypothetical protein
MLAAELWENNFFAAEQWENKNFAAELWENNNFHLRNNGHFPLFPICGTIDTYCGIVTATQDASTSWRKTDVACSSARSKDLF